MGRFRRSAGRTGSRGGRLWGVDAARGVALIGMMLVHVLTTTDDATGEPTWVGMIFSGRSAALFAVLAGVGIALLTGGSDPDRSNAEVSRDRKGLAIRAGLVVLIGLSAALLDAGVAVILVHYGLMFLLALPFLRLGAKSLFGLTAAWTALMPVVFWFAQNRLRDHEGALPADQRLWSSPALTDLARPQLLLQDLLLTGYYPLLLWPAFVFFGMAIGRLPLKRGITAQWLLLLGAGLAAGTYLVHWLAIQHTEVVTRIAASGNWSETEILGGLEVNDHFMPMVASEDWFLLATAHQGSPVGLLHHMGCAAAVLGLCLMAEKAKWLIAPLAGAGAMPLTLYVGHLVVLHFWRSDQQWIPAEFAELSAPMLAVWFVGGFLVLGLVKMLLRRRGPLEGLVYALSTTATR
ncbi:DUF1624 domain-containing protein [Nesterenkonia sp. MY13]|uniref:DUF1624 domain-containing protein n=1 Tax=Nesterenkonia sedimenti TaxID=1463632 RepID=A0A7X8YEX4_9MICC|nr:heparan-alpha-glucosaminide N-acetyltransferase domain-containing protein [Nesterenkonia sedimenti]NLS10945.1 DUF1624 domain-containing protein [Nesterenkonia sedimenti]